MRWRPPEAAGLTRAAILASVAAIAALGILSYSVIHLSTGAARDQAERQVAAAAQGSAVAVDQELRGLADLVEAYATRPRLIESIGNGSAATLDRSALRFHLNELSGVRPGISVAFVADRSGRLLDILPETPAILGQDFSFRDWYRGVTVTDAPYISEVYETAASGHPLVVAVAAPIRPAPGSTERIGILVVGYHLDTIQGFVDEFAAAQGVAVTVTDQAGVVVAAPRAPSGTMRSLRDDPSIAAALDGRSQVVERDTAEGSVVEASVPLWNLGWALSARVPTATALSVVNDLRRTVLVITVVVGATLGVGALLLVRTARRRAETAGRLSRSEAALRVNEQRLLLALDTASLGSWEIDLRSDRMVLSPSMEVICGLAPGSFDGERSSAIALIHPDDREEARRAFARSVTGDGDMDAELRIRTPAGETRWISLRGRPARSAGGEPTGAVGVAADITEQQRAQQDLRDARDAAERANAAKSEFLSRMSHELRTPLNAILGFAQLLELEDLEVGHRENVGQINRAGRHLLDLINEVLDLSRIEAGRLALSMEPVKVRDVVSEALDLVRPMAAERDIHLPVSVPSGEELHVNGDRQRLKQVLVNLLANAVKYNQEGGRVDVLCAPVPDGLLRLSVTDTGPGIAESQRALLFTPFERLGAEASATEGTGLGLALSHRLMMAMGGTIGVDSRPGHGSTFWIELTRTAAPNFTAPERPATVAVAGTGSGLQTVLYIEDNLSNVKLVERILVHRPTVTLLVATRGDLGLELAARHQPDLILLDLNLPDMTGELVLQRLQAGRRERHIPVTVLSADATPGQIERLHDLGASAYLTKPFDITHFLSIIDGTHAPAPGDGPVPPGPSTVLDPHIVQQLRELDDADGLADLVTTYRDQASTTLLSLRDSLREGDAGGAKRHAHKLKGSSASLGASRLAQLCGLVEQGATVGDLARTATLVEEIGRELRLVCDGLSAEFRSPGPMSVPL